MLWSVVTITFQNVFYLEMYQNNIFFIFLKLFLISAHQNDLKTPKNIKLKQRKKLKILIFFKNIFKMQKQIGLKYNKFSGKVSKLNVNLLMLISILFIYIELLYIFKFNIVVWLFRKKRLKYTLNNREN